MCNETQYILKSNTRSSLEASCSNLYKHCMDHEYGNMDGARADCGPEKIFTLTSLFNIRYR